MSLYEASRKENEVVEHWDPADYHCPKCGCEDLEEGPGFVGETVFRCSRCGCVWDNFDPSMIR